MGNSLGAVGVTINQRVHMERPRCMGNRGWPDQTSMRGDTLGEGLMPQCSGITGQGSRSGWVSGQRKENGIEGLQGGNEKRG